MKPAPVLQALTGILMLLLGAVQAGAQAVTIFAAASLQGPLDDIAAAWPGDATISYAGSGTIARQVSLGAPADVVMLASPDWMDWLSERGFLHGPAQDITSNRLVLIGPADAAAMPDVTADTLSARLGDGRLAMGQHMAVPAGLYGAAWLRRIGAWDTLRTRLAETENVRAALALVARGETPLGRVYASDAQADASVRVLLDAPPDMHPPILYPAAAITPAGVPFLQHLIAARGHFADAGFVALP